VTQAAVSKYARGRTRSEGAVASSPTFAQLAGRLAGGLPSGEVSPIEATSLIQTALRVEEDRGVVCQLHEEEEPALRGTGCDLCVRGAQSDLVGGLSVLGQVRRGLQVLEASPEFVALVPHVGSNLAFARPKPAGTFDVAAVPGRMYAARGVLRVPAAPEFGASRHVAEVVLAVAARFPALRAAANVRFDDQVEKAARHLGWRSVAFDAAYEGRAAQLAQAVRRVRRAPDALFHRGAFGVEPIMYVMGTSPEAVARSAVQLAQATAGRRSR
jgi:predicted fused transcriptional regulator/phosphomethylpyrimidine kinase